MHWDDLVEARAVVRRWLNSPRRARSSVRPRPPVRPRLDPPTVEPIHACGIGAKIVSGRRSSAVAVRVYVTRKLPLARVPKSQRIPREIDGVVTDVIAAEPPRVHAGGLTGRVRPLLAAHSVGHGSGTLGSITAFATPIAGGLQGLVSCAHVLAPMVAVRGDFVLQPSFIDDVVAQVDPVARLAAWRDIWDGRSIQADVAVARMLPGKRGTNAVPQLGDLTVPAIDVDPMSLLGTRVVLRGRTSAMATGRIDDVLYDGVADLVTPYGVIRLRYVDQIFIRSTSARAFSNPGDSGAPVLAEGTRELVGMLIAGSTGYSLATPVSVVRAALTEYGFVLS